jgi:hypothetical protein
MAIMASKVSCSVKDDEKVDVARQDDLESLSCPQHHSCTSTVFISSTQQQQHDIGYLFFRYNTLAPIASRIVVVAALPPDPTGGCREQY